MKTKAKMTIDTEKCKGCGLCVSVCPLKIMEIDKSITNKKGYHAARNIGIEKCIACYNMFDPKNGVALVMLFSGSNLSYNEEVIGLTGHCLS